jgi:EAL domain-containing protein (putative c-di-GMP-specific phosphodiesterase class I)
MNQHEEILKQRLIQGREPLSAAESCRAAIQFDGLRYFSRLRDLTLSSRYQPIVSIPHRRVVGYEALLNAHMLNEWVSPISAFNYIASIDQSLLAVDRLSRYIHLLNYPFKTADDWLFLNIGNDSINNFKESNNVIEDVINSNIVPAENLVFEILEEHKQDMGRLQEFVKTCKSHNILVAVDDFGAGHSNFDRIWSLAPDIVKLDSSNIWSAQKDAKVRRLLPRIISLLREAGAVVLIEGVETYEQAQIALDTEADLLQGFYFSKPQTDLSEVDHDGRISQLIAAADNGVLSGSQADNDMSLSNKFAQSAEKIVAGQTLQQAFAGYEGAQYCRAYVLSSAGVQVDSFTLLDGEPIRFKSMRHCADTNWLKRPYFFNAMDNLGQIQICSPYMSLPEGRLTKTVSMAIHIGGVRCVLCLDVAD